MFNLKNSLVALIAVLALYGVDVRANSFTITNVQGVAFVDTSRDGGPPTLRLPPEFNLVGPGLSISAFTPLAFGGDPGNVEARDICRISPCVLGTVLGTNSTFSGVLRQGATVVVNGERFEFVTLTGSLNFVSQPLVLHFEGNSRITIPFTFSGEINGVKPNTVTPIFTATLSGQGLATFLFESSPNPLSQNYFLYSIDYRFGPLPVSIDIKPATFPNTINTRSKGKIPVAILTTDSFDATAVDPTTVLFGAAGTEVGPVQSALEDVDGDGDTDMVLHFVTQDTGITCETASASLTGALFSGVTIKGSDSIETKSCN
jgi:hypothetical protein